MTAITNRLQSRLLWCVGACLERQDADRGVQVIERGTEDGQRESHIGRKVGELGGAR